MRLQVLLVEDELDDLRQYERDFPSVFSSHQADADIHPCGSFEEAFALTSNPLYRYDLIVSDTYKGPTRNRDAQVMRMVDSYRGTRFCPLVVYSSGPKPEELEETAFIVWADKGRSGDIERAINQLLDTNIPQLARKLHDELECVAGSYLWNFLEDKWYQLNEHSPLDIAVLERMVRQRAAIQIGDFDPISGSTGLLERHAPEYYIYPPFSNNHLNLGDILRGKQDQEDWRVILTPHCHLLMQSNQTKPRAEHVLLVKAIKTDLVLGEKLDNAKIQNEGNKNKKLKCWSRSPAQTEKKPEGRHWYLPGFLDIPHSFCDFLQIESVSYETITTNFERIATLTQPYAEALQSCFTGFYSAVGIPNCNTMSIKNMLD
jgi:hypothetical protein